MTTAVLERVAKWFGDVVAVSDVSCEVGPGLTALLGPNGAGKSTVLRLLCGLTRPSDGTVRVLGRDPAAEPGLGGRLGLVPQHDGLPAPLTGRDLVRLAAVLEGVARPDRAAEAALGTVGLDATDDRPLRNWSKGMRQRAKVAAALVHDPEVLVLDEPLEGLDPRQRLALVDLFRRLADEGRTVLVSSHVLEEVQRLGSRVLVLVGGRLAAQGDFHDLRRLMADRPARVRVECDDPGRLAAALLAEGLVAGVRLDGTDGVVLDTPDVRRLGTRVAPVARDAGLHLRAVVPLDDDLESVFRYLLEAP